MKEYMVLNGFLFFQNSPLFYFMFFGLLQWPPPTQGESFAFSSLDSGTVWAGRSWLKCDGSA